jgi:LacI family transcriptional regulator
VSPTRRARVTLRDIAELAGVPVTTVSFVLSGRRDMRVSAEIEELVFQAARKLNYRRRLVPSAPIPTGAPAIGLISDVVATEAFAGEMVRGCVAAAAERGHVILMADSEGVDDLESSAVQALLSRRVERFIYGTMGTIIYRVPEALRVQRLVLMNNIDSTLIAPSVIPDDTTAGMTAVTALTDAGHTSGIWLVGETSAYAVAGRRRLTGIKAGLRAAGVRLAGHVQCGWWPEESRAALIGLFESGWWERERPTAVIAMNDRTAMGVYQAAARVGLSIPDDLSVISFDNSDIARWLHPGLSSMNLPYFELGRRAVELLLADHTQRRVHKVPMQLRSRGSVAPPSPSRRRIAGSESTTGGGGGGGGRETRRDHPGPGSRS